MLPRKEVIPVAHDADLLLIDPRQTHRVTEPDF
jgi:hypothetical protein